MYQANVTNNLFYINDIKVTDYRMKIFKHIEHYPPTLWLIKFIYFPQILGVYRIFFYVYGKTDYFPKRLKSHFSCLFKMHKNIKKSGSTILILLAL